MYGEEFMEVFNNRTLRNYLVDICKAFTKNVTIQEDLLQEAWLRIGQCPAGYTIGYYMEQGFKGINNAYQKEWKSWRLTRQGKKNLHKRVNRIMRKYSN